MSDPVVVALIVGGFAFTGQIVGAMMSTWARREDWRRQDEVADRTEGQLNEIHSFVNSILTRSMVSELAGARRELMMAQELGRPQAVIEEIHNRIDELVVSLTERADAD